MENASSPYVILNRPSAVWQPVIDREKETQQHVGVKVRARSISSRFLDRRSLFKRGPRLDAARRRRDPGAVRPETARTRPGSRRSRATRGDGRVRPRDRRRGGCPAPDLPSPSSPFSALRRHEATPVWISWEKSRPTASLAFTEMPAGTCRGRFFSPNAVARANRLDAKARTPLTDPTPSLSRPNKFFSFVTRTHRSTASVRAAGAVCT